MYAALAGKLASWQPGNGFLSVGPAPSTQHEDCARYVTELRHTGSAIQCMRRKDLAASVFQLGSSIGRDMQVVSCTFH